MDMDKKRQELKVEIRDGLLVISIGIETLAFFAVIHSAMEGSDPECNPQILISDAQGFANEVAEALMEENHNDGTTPTHSLLDCIFETVYENGSTNMVDASDGDEKVIEACKAFRGQIFNTCFYRSK